jgi:hypothetical protein
MIAGIAAKLGPKPPDALDTKWDLKECKALIKIAGWCLVLPKDRDISNPDQPRQIERLAEDIIASVDGGEVSIEDLKSKTYGKSKEFPVMFITAIQAAESALKLRQCPPHHHTIIHAMYNEHERIKSKAELEEGQDFVRVKVGSMRWLYGKYAAPGSSWNYIAVDDGCPQDPPSGKLMEAVSRKRVTRTWRWYTYSQPSTKKSHPLISCRLRRTVERAARSSTVSTVRPR